MVVSFVIALTMSIDRGTGMDLAGAGAIETMSKREVIKREITIKSIDKQQPEI